MLRVLIRLPTHPYQFALPTYQVALQTWVGIESVAAMLRAAVKLDPIASSAHDCISRAAVFHKPRDVAPSVLPLAWMVYVVGCCHGQAHEVRQGVEHVDPLAPATCVVGQHDALVELICALPQRRRQGWQPVWRGDHVPDEWCCFALGVAFVKTQTDEHLPFEENPPSHCVPAQFPGSAWLLPHHCATPRAQCLLGTVRPPQSRSCAQVPHLSMGNSLRLQPRSRVRRAAMGSHVLIPMYTLPTSSPRKPGAKAAKPALNWAGHAVATWWSSRYQLARGVRVT